jgi:hypothetical protein
MIELSDNDIAAYFRRSYKAVDGLWFMKAEEKEGFEKTLDMDNEVWKIMPKIQARTLKNLTKTEHGIDALFECLTTKLYLEGYLFSTERYDDDGFMIIIGECPWHSLMVKSNRQEIAGKVGTRICRTEYEVWANEFDGSIQFEMNDFICDGDKNCILKFKTLKKAPEKE